MSTDQQPSQAEKDEVMGTCIAMLRAGLADDHEGAELLASTVNLRHALACMSGIAGSYGIVAYRSPGRFAAALTDWQPGRLLAGHDAEVDPNANLEIYPDAADLMAAMQRLDRVRLEHVARWIARRLAGGLE
jgi:hypothetical protein